MSSTAPTQAELDRWRSGISSAGWVHLNSAGAAPVSAAAHEAISSHLELERTMGGYAAMAARAEAGGRDARAALATLLSCDADEVALVESAQVGWAKAFYSLAFLPSDRILCWSSEYAGNAVAYLQQARRHGVAIEVLPMRRDGRVDVDALAAALRRETAGRTLVALTHVQTGESTVQPAEEVGALAKAHGAVFLLDSCQTVGQLEVNIQCDFCCGTGRKWLRGPRGTGFLYCRRDALPSGGGSRGMVGEPPMVDHVGARMLSASEYALEEGAKRYEMFEASEACRAGLAAAVDLCLEESTSTAHPLLFPNALAVGAARIGALAAAHAHFLRVGLEAIEGIKLRDSPNAANDAAAPPRCGIVSFDASAVGISSKALAAALFERKIGVSVSPSVHTFDESRWELPPALRVSPSYFNTKEELIFFLDVVKEIVSQAS
ncbi:hypothetical protein AB1Y20_010907 [Prymnesium parvum]|uniref:Aminotransferase class V domain-containing protein n=1 Tax=Prymnesium parvum TaxID=97485 RepID=A0AB34ISR4_PRYPA